MDSLSYEGTSRTVETSVGTLHYHEVGEGPPLVLLHGSGPGESGWSDFADNLPLFAKHFRTLVLDLPGFGGSKATVDGHPMNDAPAALVSFLDELGIDRVAILGSSMGGGIGAQVAAARPERVSRLATIGGVGVNVFSTMPSEGIRTLVDFVEKPTRPNLVRWIQSMLYDQTFLTDELIEERWKLATAPGAVDWLKKMYSYEGAKTWPAFMAGALGPAPWFSLGKIEAPTLLMWGRDDLVSPVDMAIVPMRIIPKCELHVFYDCGHWVMMERKEEFESVALSFLTRG